MNPPSPSAPNVRPLAAPPPLPRRTEGRQFPRAPYTAIVRVDRQGPPAFEGRISNISEGGIMLLAHGTCTPGEIVLVRFGVLPRNRVLETYAEVRWVRHAFGMISAGLEFRALPEWAQGSIREYVAHMAPTATERSTPAPGAQPHAPVASPHAPVARPPAPALVARPIAPAPVASVARPQTHAPVVAPSSSRTPRR